MRLPRDLWTRSSLKMCTLLRMNGWLFDNHAAQSIDAIRHDRTLSEESKADLNQALGTFMELWNKKVKQNK